MQRVENISHNNCEPSLTINIEKVKINEKIQPAEASYPHWPVHRNCARVKNQEVAKASHQVVLRHPSDEPFHLVGV